MDVKKLASSIGTFAVVGIASTAGAALWTNVLEDKVKRVRCKLEPTSDKVIDFEKAKRSMGR